MVSELVVSIPLHLCSISLSKRRLQFASQYGSVPATLSAGISTLRETRIRSDWLVRTSGNITGRNRRESSGLLPTVVTQLAQGGEASDPVMETQIEGTVDCRVVEC